MTHQDNEGTPEESDAKRLRRRHAETERRLRAAFPPEQQLDPLGIDLPRTFLLSAAVPDLLRLLLKAARGALSRRYRAAGGYYKLQSPRLQEPAGGDPLAASVISIGGLFYSDGGGFIFHDRLIYFSINPLADGRIAAQAVCTHEAVAELYHSLLRKVEGAWPDA